ncbi:MAG: hypothetical protein P8Z31_05470 [Gammaproteobacteria bacterium]|jgi:hypothetical protein
MSTRKVLLICLAALFAAALDARETAAPATLCTTTVAGLNQRFITTKGLDSNGNIPGDSGLIVHTIHGPGTGAAELNMKQLNALPVDASKTCGAFMNMSPPVYLPWCGSNRNPLTHQWDDSSSWTYIRHDTLLHGAALQRPDEVVCDDTNNKKYGLIFSNAFMNEGNNLGCMYPLDGDTGKRVKMGCGISQNDDIDRSDAQGRCASTETLSEYLADFQNLLTDDGGRFASYAGSLICSLSKPQFDLWVDARKRIDLSKTAWPVNEFVLFDWDTYSTSELASKQFLTGIYYLSGCSEATDGKRQDAQAIADLYRKWSGVEVPVVNLSNSAMRAKSTTPFSCQ